MPDPVRPEDCLRSLAAEALLWAPHRPLFPESLGLMGVANLDSREAGEPASWVACQAVAGIRAGLRVAQPEHGAKSNQYC